MSQLKPLVVRHQHIYATCVNGHQLCASGARVWFLQHGLSWSDFIANGITTDKLIDTGDAFALAVVATAQKMEVAIGADDGQ